MQQAIIVFMGLLVGLALILSFLWWRYKKDAKRAKVERVKTRNALGDAAERLKKLRRL